EDKVIHIVGYRGGDKSKQNIFEYGVNILRCSISENFSTPTNQAIMLGAGFGSEQLRVVVNDATTQTIYGLRQQTISEIDVSESGTLISKGEGSIRKYKTPVLNIAFSQ